MEGGKEGGREDTLIREATAEAPTWERLQAERSRVTSVEDFFTHWQITKK